jgi:uncharacterized protein (DUF58 family)
VRLTRRGVAVLGVAVLLAASGLWGRYPLPAVLGAAAVGVVLAALLFTARPPEVRVSRSVHPDLVERGRPAVARLRIRNTGARHLTDLLATDAVGPDTRVVRVADLAPDTEATGSYDLPTGARGRLTVGPLTLERMDPFGLARRRVTAGEVATVRVHPRQWPAHPPGRARRRGAHEEGTVDDARRGAADLRDVREYVPGDEVRHLHWKATARTGRLMVRDLADPRRRRLTVLLDTRARVLSATAFDEAVDVAASLLRGAARAGHPARVVTATGREVAVDGPYAVRPMLDALSELDPDDASPDAALPAPVGAGGDLVVLTAGAGALTEAARLRRRFPGMVLIAIGPSGPSGPASPAGSSGLSGSDTVGGVPVLRAVDAEQAVHRWNEANR